MSALELENGNGFGRLRLEPANLVGVLALGAVTASLFSVFAFGLLFGLAVAAWGWDCLRLRRWNLRFPPFYWPVFVFLGLVLISIACSPDVAASAPYLKKFLKFLVFAFVYTYVGRRLLVRGVAAVLVAAGLSAAWGIGQYFWLKKITLLNRIDGFMSHWMTFSGQMMICAIVSLALLLAGRRFLRSSLKLQALLLVLFGLLAAATLLSFTRSAWIGLGAGTLALLCLSRPRWALAGLPVLALLFLFLPESFHARLMSGFDLKDTTTRGRLELAQTGLDLVRDHPLTGVGPRLLRESAAREAAGDFPSWMYQHLHNNPLQIAAELGLPALLAWLAIWVKILIDLVRMSRSRDELVKSLAWGGIGVVASVHLMGLFEYNFGDSEIVVLTLFIVTAAYTARRNGSTEGAGG